MDNVYMNQYMKEKYKRRRSEAITKLGGLCNNCGSNHNLHFHHKNPSEKRFTLARGSSYSQKRWDEEVEKCILLCQRCHTNQHESRQLCGTVHRYWSGCRCGPCKTANARYHREYKQSRELK